MNVSAAFFEMPALCVEETAPPATHRSNPGIDELVGQRQLCAVKSGQILLTRLRPANCPLSLDGAHAAIDNGPQGEIADVERRAPTSNIKEPNAHIGFSINAFAALEAGRAGRPFSADRCKTRRRVIVDLSRRNSAAISNGFMPCR